MKKVVISLLVFAGSLNAMTPQEAARINAMEQQRNAAMTAGDHAHERVQSGTSTDVAGDCRTIMASQAVAQELGDQLGYPPSIPEHNSHTTQQGPGPDDQEAYQRSLDSCKQ